MKTFTYTQKKWAMASALLLVLGFNVSFNSHSGGLASLDLASESDVVPSKITTSSGVANVKYIKTGDKEVLALVPKINEGSYCEKCGYERYTLNVAMTKNTEDIDALNVALMKKMEEDKAKPAVEPKAEPKSAPTEEAAPKKIKLTFAEKVNKKCGTQKDSSEALDCRLTEISAVLGDEKINQREVSEFYGRWVQQELARAIASDDQSVNQTAMDQLTALQDNLITEKGWKDLRQRLGLTMAAAIGYAGNTVHTFYSNYQMAINNKDLNASNYWMKMYQAGQNSIFAAKNNFASMQTSWANSSLQEQSISYADLNTIVWSYSNPAEQIYSQIVSSPQTFNFVNGQVVTNAVVTAPNSPNQPGSISNPGTVVVQQPDGSLMAARLVPGRGIGNGAVVGTMTPVTPTTVGTAIGVQATPVTTTTLTPSATGASVQYMALPLSGLADRMNSVRAQ